MDEKTLARGLINKFKLLKEPGSTEFIAIPLKFNSHNLRKNLKTYMLTLSARNADDVRVHIIDDNGYDDYDREYLEVIGTIGKIFGVTIYMGERLEGEIIFPVKRLFIVGQATEASVTAHIARYLFLSYERIVEVVRKNRPKEHNANKYLTQLRKDFYGKINQNLLDIKNGFELKKMLVNPEALKLKNTRVLEYMLKNFIFDFNDKNENPIFGEIKPTTLDVFKVTDGKWVKHGLLWTRRKKITNN